MHTFSDKELARQRAEDQEQNGGAVATGFACGGWAEAPPSRTPHRVHADFTGADPRFRNEQYRRQQETQPKPPTGGGGGSEPVKEVTVRIEADAAPATSQIKKLTRSATAYPDGNPKTAAGMKKPDLSVIPPVALLHLATAMMNGANKYGPFNWRDQAISYRPYLAAAMRHCASCLDGEDFSQDTVETGLPVHHLGHVMACCAIVLDAIHCGTINDNRPKVPGSTGDAIELYNREKRLLPE